MASSSGKDYSIDDLDSSTDQYFTGSSSSYHSARIQRLIDDGKQESDIEDSKVHWSQVDSTASETEPHSAAETTNREYFELLKRRKYAVIGDQMKGVNHLLMDQYEIVVGEKLAEGGQAEIYEARWFGGDHWVVKVFKAGSLLQDLERQFPPALLHGHRYVYGPGTSNLPGTLYGVTLLKDERFFDRFAFVMERCWGDLRKLIDQRMIQRSHPLFPPKQVVRFMREIAFDMNRLHEQHPPILHNDLKASNVLVCGTTTNNRVPYLEDGMYRVTVADFECSMGVVGTGFWRAPEILQQLKDRIPMSKVVFTDKCDVYSFGMTCYELVTGHIPFEGCPFSNYDMVLNGGRPKLPVHLVDPLVREIIVSCWHADPSKRPSFEDILKKLPQVSQ